MEDIHIGKIIKEQVDLSPLSVYEIAEMLSCKRQNVYDIFKRKSIDTDLLIRLSKILNYDFLANVYMARNKSLGTRVQFSMEITDGEVTEITATQARSKSAKSAKNAKPIRILVKEK